MTALRARLRRPGTAGHGFALGPLLRHGVGPAGAAVLAVALLTWPEGEGTGDAWFDLGNRLAKAVFRWGLPVVAACACWLGGTDARSGTGWLGETAARPTLSRTLAGLAPAVLWPLAGYAVAASLLAMPVWSESAPALSPFPLDSVSSNAALLAATACLGYGVGRIAPLRVTAPLTGLAVAAVCSEQFAEPVGLTDGGARRTYTAPGVHGLTGLYGTAPPRWLPWLVTAVFLGIAVAAVLACARRWTLTTVALLALTPVVLWLAASPDLDGDLRTAPPPVRLSCSASAPHVCVGADVDADEAQLRLIVRELTRRLDGVRGVPTHYVITGEWPSADEFPSSRSPGGSWTVATSYDGDTDAALLSPLTWELADRRGVDCDDPDLEYDVAVWLIPPRMRPMLVDSDDENARTVARLDALPRPQRTAWLSRYFTRRMCEPPPPASPEHEHAHSKGPTS